MNDANIENIHLMLAHEKRDVNAEQQQKKARADKKTQIIFIYFFMIHVIGRFVHFASCSFFFFFFLSSLTTAHRAPGHCSMTVCAVHVCVSPLNSRVRGHD